MEGLGRIICNQIYDVMLPEVARCCMHGKNKKILTKSDARNVAIYKMTISILWIHEFEKFTWNVFTAIIQIHNTIAECLFTKINLNMQI